MKIRIVAAVVAAFALACGNLDDLKVDENGELIEEGGPRIIEGEAELRVPGQYIVRLHQPAGAFTSQTNAQLSASLATRYQAQVKRSFLTIPGFVATMSATQAKKLAVDPAVAYVEQDAVIKLSATQSGATWGLDRIDQRDRPLDSSYTYATTASNVNAYIVDTGIRRTHQDFGGRAVIGFDAIGDGQNTNDCQGHGTHVAGTVGGSTWGVAKGVKLYAVRVLNCQGSGTNSGVIAGIDWVTANHIKPAVANMSLGGGASQAIDDAVQRAVAAGVSMVVAAGNENTDACTKSPARAPNAITVGSTTNTDARSSFSNYGTCVDLFAPGSSITSTWNTSDSATNTISGTSMASPHTAGAAALYLAANPSATPAQVRDALVNNGSAGKISSVGTGSPNVLLYTGTGGSTPPPPPPGDVTTETRSGSVTQGEMKQLGSFSVKEGTQFKVVMTGSGDPDLYVRWGSAPTTSSYNCRPYLNGASETCDLSVPTGTTLAYVAVRGYTAASYSLTISYTKGSTTTPPPSPGTPSTATYSGSVSSGQFKQISSHAVLAGTTFKVTMTGSGDPDLYVRWGSAPTKTSYNCRPYKSGASETCSLTVPSGTTSAYVAVNGYTAGSYNLTVEWTKP